MPPPTYRTSFTAFPDSLAAVESDQYALACQLGLCQVAAGRWSALEGVAERIQAFVVPRAMSLLIGGCLLGATALLIG